MWVGSHLPSLLLAPARIRRHLQKMPKSVRISHWAPAFAGATKLLISAITLLCVSALSAAPIKTEHVEVELIAPQTALVAGKTARVGLSIKHQPHWHTYWKNPGDSGYPTKVTWALPKGYAVSEFAWPAPQRIATGPIINFGYDGEILLTADVTVPADAIPGSVTLKGKAEWLVCKDVCIPEDGEVSLTLPVADAAGVSVHKSRFDAADAAVPKALAGWTGKAAVAGREMLIEITPAAGAPALVKFDVFPEPEQITDPSVQKVYRTSTGYAAQLKLVDGAKVPPNFALVLTAGEALNGAASSSKAGVISVTTSAAGASAAVPAGAVLLADASANATLKSGAAATTLAVTGGNDVTLVSALVLAFFGGMILNLMPCVFPVLSLKILSFAKHGGGAPSPTNELDRPRGRGRSRWLRNGVQSHEGATDHEQAKRSAMRQHGIFYAVGVVLSFLALAGVLLALKSAGSAIGWGFQLQNPGVVWVLAIIFFLIGLNLMGAFEVGQLAPSALLSMQAKHPGVDAFFSGVLAVIAASPCTAPFMGAALGFALTQSAVAALSVFAALGVGMALPYVLLAWFPKWLDKLPRPGQWMVTFKQLLAFPMFATVAWLVWVVAIQTGADGAAIVLLGLVGLALGAWLIGSQKGAARWTGAAVVLAAAVLAWPSADASQAAASGAVKSGGVTWQAWDAATVDKLTAEGKPVFVDFTAAWCVSCQVNKRTVLTRSEIEQLFATKKVTLMRADWTNRDERITQALAAMNRSGVPVYVLHAPGKAPQLLPEILTTGIVRDALNALP